MGLLRKLVFVLVFIVFSLLVILLSCLVVLMLQSTNNREDEGNMKLYRYQEVVVDSSSLKTTTGIITIPELIKKDQFLYEKNINGKEVLISNFGSSKFYCTGSCICEVEQDEDEYRRTAKVITRGFSYLLVAVSSLAAYNLAKKEFQKECIDSSETCPIDSIQSEVEECKPILQKCESVDEDKNEVTESTRDDGTTSKEENDELETYFCSGECLEILKQPKLPPKKEEEKTFGKYVKWWIQKIRFWDPRYQCEDLTLEKEIVVNVRNGEDPVRKFQEEYMREFCEHPGKTFLSDFLDSKKLGRLYETDFDEEMKKIQNSPLTCTANHDGKVNPTIKCGENPSELDICEIVHQTRF